MTWLNGKMRKSALAINREVNTREIGVVTNQKSAGISLLDFFISSISCWSVTTVSSRTVHFVSCGSSRLQVVVAEVESDVE